MIIIRKSYYGIIAICYITFLFHYIQLRPLLWLICHKLTCLYLFSFKAAERFLYYLELCSHQAHNSSRNMHVTLLTFSSIDYNTMHVSSRFLWTRRSTGSSCRILNRWRVCLSLTAAEEYSCWLVYFSVGGQHLL